VLGVIAAFTFSTGVSGTAANPARFGQRGSWPRSWSHRARPGAGQPPASRVLRAVAAGRDVTGVDGARIPGGAVRPSLHQELHLCCPGGWQAAAHRLDRATLKPGIVQMPLRGEWITAPMS
jgi:hypothetical protein